MDVEADHIRFDGRTCYWKYCKKQEYETFLGKVEVPRNVYQANGEGQKSVCPLELNVGISEEGWRQAEAGTISFYDEHCERTETTYVGQMPEKNAATFKAKLDREIEPVVENLPTGCQIVCLADAALANWAHFDKHPRLKDAVKIVDFYHAAEHLKKAADALFKPSEKQRSEAWVEKQRENLQWKLKGVEKVIASIRYYLGKLS